jgi:DNA-binding response OmpR family regulator
MNKAKILIIDDESHIVEMLKIRLDSAGYETIAATDGAEGLRLARETNPNLIILDIMLPKLDGYKVCGLLKADTRYNKIPIIMFTARTEETDKKVSEEVGANAYITKPFKSEVLLDKIKELLTI